MLNSKVIRYRLRRWRSGRSYSINQCIGQAILNSVDILGFYADLFQRYIGCWRRRATRIRSPTAHKVSKSSHHTIGLLPLGKSTHSLEMGHDRFRHVAQKDEIL